jgi:AcrR family transcriptional regulator
MSEPVAVPAESSDRVRKGERTRLRILDAAAQVLARQGYAAATLTEIASVAQMQAGSLYYHFDSKDAIVEEVLRVGIDHASEAICQATAALGPGANGHDRLLAAVAAYTANLVADSDFTRANIRCFEEAPLLTRENLAVPLREFATVWVALLEAGQADGSLRSDVEANVVARMTIAALNSCVQWYRPDGVLDVDEVAAMFATSLVDGLSSGFA